MDISVSDIQKDIAEYKDRIHLAKSRLSELPEGYLQLKRHKVREKQRNEYKSDIKYYSQLVSYAVEGIQLRLKKSEG